MKVDLFDFNLPPALIAQHPAEPRDSSRLLHVSSDGLVHDRTIRDLPGLLDSRDLLVVNDTKVIPTRLFGQRGEAQIEATLVEETSASAESCVWTAFAKPGKRLRPSDTVVFAEGLSAKVQDKLPDGRVVLAFAMDGTALREGFGGSVACRCRPTLSESRTRPLPRPIRIATIIKASSLKKKVPLPRRQPACISHRICWTRSPRRGIESVRITLHVGAGTFLPVKSDDTADHIMHSEWAHISEEAAARIADHKASGGRIVAVGTTALRTLESAARSGSLKAFEGDTDSVHHAWI